EVALRAAAHAESSVPVRGPRGVLEIALVVVVDRTARLPLPVAEPEALIQRARREGRLGGAEVDVRRTARAPARERGLEQGSAEHSTAALGYEVLLGDEVL